MKNTLKELKKSDLEIGDILVFEDFDFEEKKFKSALDKDGFSGAFNYLLHYLIAWFDSGKDEKNYKNIYHAGIWGNVNRKRNDTNKTEDCVIQAGRSVGIGSATLESMLIHHQVMNIYVCRPKNKDNTFTKNINNSVRNFYDVNRNYSTETAWLLSVICSLRYSKGTLYKLLEKKFGNLEAHFLVFELLNLINYYNDQYQKEMIACSTLVAMIYKNAGYELPVNVFQVQSADKKFPEPKFSLDNINIENTSLSGTNAKDWPQLKETVVTPRQLMESNAVEVVGFFKHRNK